MLRTEQEMLKFNRIYQWLNNDLRLLLGEISQRYHLTYDQYTLLKVIKVNNHISGSELAAQLNISRAAISRRCRELQVAGLIEGISRQEPDYRLTYFETSQYGDEVLAELGDRYEVWLEKVNEGYGLEKFTQLVQLMDELAIQTNVVKQRLG